MSASSQDNGQEAADDGPGRPQQLTARPVSERWWWWLLVSGSLWLRLLEWPFDRHHTRFENGFAVFSFVVLLVGTPTFFLSRRRSQSKRLGCAAQ